MIVRLATADDDSAIAALMESVPMPGAMRLVFGCRPSFFQALRVAGDRPLVCVAQDGGQLVAVGAVTCREVFLNGRIATLRYLSALRVAPQGRGSAALARGFACLRTALADWPGELTLTSILEENVAAQLVLTGARAGLPPYVPLGGCVTRVVAAGRAAQSRTPHDVEIVAGGDADEIAGFIATHGPSRNFYPVCRAEDLGGREDSAFPGLTSDDILVARDRGGILGVMGCWDVRRFRQTRVAGYATWLGWARPWLNLGARFARRPLLPQPGATLGLAYGTLTLIRNNEPRVFGGLLEATLDMARRRGLERLVVALAAGDPLGVVFNGRPHHAIRSRIFHVHFEPPATPHAPDGRTPHFEAAML